MHLLLLIHTPCGGASVRGAMGMQRLLSNVIFGFLYNATFGRSKERNSGRQRLEEEYSNVQEAEPQVGYLPKAFGK